MAPIRNGDGTGLDPKDFSQIRKGDGTVLWTAIPDSVVDNFEDFSDGPYETGDDITTFYGGDTGNAQRVKSPVFEGSYAVEVTDDGRQYSITSTSGLPRYPSPGDTFQARSYSGDGSRRTGFIWAANTDGSASTDLEGYMSWLAPADDNIVLYRWNGGEQNRTTLDTAPVSPPAQEWVTHDVSWGQNGDITVDIINSSDTTIATLSANDTTYQREGIGWHTTGGGGGVSYHDFCEITGSV